MAMKTTVVIEVIKDYQLYTFTMPYGRPLQECYDACQDVIKEIIDFSKSLQKQQEEQAQRSSEETMEPEKNVQE